MVLFDINQKKLKKCRKWLKKLHFDTSEGEIVLKCNFYTYK